MGVARRVIVAPRRPVPRASDRSDRERGRVSTCRPRPRPAAGGYYARPLVEPGPLPPHERPWRHPSEIAAATRHEIRTERPSGAVRAAALLGGTTTALLMGVLVLSLTPERMHGPTVAGSVPIRDADDTVAAEVGPEQPSPSPSAPHGADGERPTPDARSTDDTPPPLATVVALDGTAVAPSGAVIARMSRPIAAPLTRSAPIIERISRDRPTIGPLNPQVEVVLGDGTTTVAQVLDPGDGSGLAIVRVPPPPGHDARAPAPGPPMADSLVTVLTPEPLPMRLGELLDSLPHDGAVPADELPYPDGTPVVDDAGRLVGVLACHDEGMELIPISPDGQIGQDTAEPPDDGDGRPGAVTPAAADGTATPPSRGP